MELREKAERYLRMLAGEDARLREDQWRAIHALVAEHRRALVVQRTGWGKSAVYFVATALLREQGCGPTVIVSPLLALMRNQVDAAGAAGVHAATINSANQQEWRQIEESVAGGTTDVLLVSPERLNNPDFRDAVLPALARSAGMLVVDEAHCISDWGHDFRPDYRRLATLLTTLPADVPVLATTATANDRVVTDVADQLGVGETDSARTLVLRGPLDRESLHLGVLRLPNQQARLGWLGEHLAELRGSGIIYTLTVSAAEDVADYLRSLGYDVTAYSGRTGAEERQRAEEDLLHNKVKALVATSALGMGFDKPDLGFVVHLGAPSSPIAYYQQIGRAGRGVRRADVVLIPGSEDRQIWQYFASLAFPPEQVVRGLLAELSTPDVPTSTAALEPRVPLSRTRLETVLKVLDVDGAVTRVRGGWIATGEPWVYDGERYRRVAEARSAEQQAMLDYLDSGSCRMEFLRKALDDPAAEPCGRCDNCSEAALSTDVSATAREGAAERLRRPGVALAPRKMWPTAMGSLGVELSGKIAPSETASEGRTLGRMTGIGWGSRLRELLGAGAEDSAVPGDVFDACVRVLGGWDWAERPAAVVGIASARRPELVASLAERLSSIGRLPLLGVLDTVRGGTSAVRGTQVNSAKRLASVWGALRLPEALATQVPTVTGPVLLVDDLVDTGWTMTVAARLLRRAGASHVLPFALATTA